MAAIFFTFSSAAHAGAVKGDGWDVAYQGHESGSAAWLAVQADGFALKPGTNLTVNGDAWTAQVVRG